MQLNHERLERQIEGVNKWFDSNCIGTLNWFTGVGKTNGGIIAIKKLERLRKHSYLVTVPSDVLKGQWYSILEKTFGKGFMDRCRVVTPHEILYNTIRIEVDVIIVDEVHEFATEDRLTILNKYAVYWRKFLGLTANADDKNFDKILMHIPIVDIISEKEAREKKFISEFVEYNLAVTLTEKEKENYDRFSEIIDGRFAKFKKDIELVQKCLNGGKDKNNNYYSGIGWATSLAMSHGWRADLNFNIYEDKIIDDNFNPNVLTNDARRLMDAVRRRKEVVNNASYKYTITLELLKRFNKVKTILFSESTDFADRIGMMARDAGIPTSIYHSQLKTKLAPSHKTGKLIKFGKERQKKEAIEFIKKGITRVLSSTCSLDRGLDVFDLRMGVTTSGKANTTQYTQRGGRVKRFEEGVTVLLVTLYVKGTVDEGWTKKRQEKVEHSIEWITSINEISYTPPPNKEFI